VTQVLVKEYTVLLTTSRNPTESIRTLCRDISRTFPNVLRINRGKLSLEGVAEKTWECEAERAVILDRWEKGFGKIEFFAVGQSGLTHLQPTVCLSGVRFRRELCLMPKGTKIESAAIAVSSKGNCETKRFENVLSEVFNFPLLSLEEAVNRSYDIAIQVLSETSKRMAITSILIPEQIEIGPRMEISHLVWELGQ
jgi:rRNA maturation protein Rpf1